MAQVILKLASIEFSDSHFFRYYNERKQLLDAFDEAPEQLANYIAKIGRYEKMQFII